MLTPFGAFDPFDFEEECDAEDFELRELFCAGRSNEKNIARKTSLPKGRVQIRRHLAARLVERNRVSV
jgi:hypothetical protein